MRKVSAIFLLLAAFSSYAQDDLMDILNDTAEEETRYTIATFKSTRLINGQSIETRTVGVLEFLIEHRFGQVNSGFDELFGLDNANIRFGFEYGITDDLNVGIGRSSFNKVFDGFLKYKLIKQSNRAPVTLALFSAATLNTNDFPLEDAGFEGIHRYSYTHQILLARKFNPSISFQIMPTYIHRNLVATGEDANDLISLGMGGRVKLNTRLAINAEWYPQLTEKSSSFRNAFAIGLDIETGGHVFQLHVTNAQQMNEPGFIGETTGNFLDGDIHFGFNISRVFNLRRHG